MAVALEPQFDEVRFLDYDHWEVNGAEMDLEHEIARAAELAKGFGEYVVVAKSMGAVLATLGNARGLLASKRCVFLGFPLQAVRELPQELEVARALTQLLPTAFVHNQNDPLGPAEAVQSFIQAHAPANYDFRTTPGDTHDYVDFGLIEQLAMHRGP